MSRCCSRTGLASTSRNNIKKLFIAIHICGRSGYQHKTVKIIDRMLLEALVASDQGYVIHNSRGERIRLSEACDDVRTFARLTDDLLFKTIQYSTSGLFRFVSFDNLFCLLST